MIDATHFLFDIEGAIKEASDMASELADQDDRAKRIVAPLDDALSEVRSLAGYYMGERD